MQTVTDLIHLRRVSQYHPRWECSRCSTAGPVHMCMFLPAEQSCWVFCPLEKAFNQQKLHVRWSSVWIGLDQYHPKFHFHLGWYWETFTRWLTPVTVNISSLSEIQLLSQASVIPFKMQDFFPCRHTPQVPEGSAICASPISSAPTCLLSFLGLERMLFTGCQQGECWQALLWEENTQVNDTVVNWISGHCSRCDAEADAFLVFWLSWGQRRKLQC